MTVFLGADHGGFAAKEQLKEQLRSQGYQVEDCGAAAYDPEDDYPVYAAKVGRAVAEHPDARGIVFCRSGHGVVIAANKIPGVRAVLGVNEASAIQSRQHDDANVLGFGVDFMDTRQVLPVALAWLATSFEGGRHIRRIKKISDLEKSS